MSNETDFCFYCGKTSGEDKDVKIEKCEDCGLVGFCGEVHKRLHARRRRKKKKGTEEGVDMKFCNKFIVRISEDNRGRYMVASQDISPGETVLLEDSGPFVACPNLRTNVAVCLECFSPTEASPTEEKSDPCRCPKCSYPLCPECQQNGNVHHGQEECEILSACVARASEDNRIRFFKATGKRTAVPLPKEIVSDMSAAACEAVYGSVGPLRLLLAAGEKKEDYVSFIKDFTDNSDLKRKEDSRGWAMVHAVAAGFLRGACKLAERFSADDVYKAVGMLMTNGVKLECSNGRRRGEGRGGLGLYPAYSLLNHSCLPNTRTKKDAEAGRHALELVAIMPIAKGEEITTRYITPQWDTTRRQSMLRGHWHFVCQCHRCVDPSECGSMLGALRCRRTKGCDGSIVPERPTRPEDTMWVCDQCELGVGGREAEVVVRVAEDKIRAISRMKDSYPTPLSEDDAYAELTARLERDLLHRNHFLLMRTAEFRIQKLRKRLKSGQVKDQDEKRELLTRQASLFERLSEVMSPADPPGDLWNTALDKARAELDKFEKSDK